MQGTTPSVTSCTSSLPGSDTSVSALVGLGGPHSSRFSLGPVDKKSSGTELDHSVTPRVGGGAGLLMIMCWPCRVINLSASLIRIKTKSKGWPGAS